MSFYIDGKEYSVVYENLNPENQKIVQILLKSNYKIHKRGFNINDFDSREISIEIEKINEINSFINKNIIFYNKVIESSINSLIFIAIVNSRVYSYNSAFKGGNLSSQHELCKELYEEIPKKFYDILGFVNFGSDQLSDRINYSKIASTSCKLMFMLDDAYFSFLEKSVSKYIKKFDYLKDDNYSIKKYFETNKYNDIATKYFTKNINEKFPVKSYEDFCLALVYLFFFRGINFEDLGKYAISLRSRFNTFDVRNSGELKQVNFYLKNKTKKKLDDMAKRLDTTRTKIIEFMIDNSNKYRVEEDIRRYLDIRSIYDENRD